MLYVPDASALVLLQSQTASASASIDFTSYITSSFKVYEIECADVVLGTVSATLKLLVSEDAGSNWKSGAADYAYTGIYAGTGSALAKTGSAGAAFIGLCSDYAVRAGVCGTIKFYSPAGTSRRKRFGAVWTMEQGTGTGEYVQSIDAGQYLSSNAINGVRIIPSAGNIAAGTFTLYGRRS